MPIVLLVILWHSRNHNPLYGAGLALLATIFLAPVVQAWYLVWPLAMFAVTKVRIRWFIIAITFLSCVVLPDGSGLTKFLQPTMSFVMTGIVIWAFVRGLTWLRGFEPERDRVHRGSRSADSTGRRRRRRAGPGRHRTDRTGDRGRALVQRPVGDPTRRRLTGSRASAAHASVVTIG